MNINEIIFRFSAIIHINYSPHSCTQDFLVVIPAYQVDGWYKMYPPVADISLRICWLVCFGIVCNL